METAQQQGASNPKDDYLTNQINKMATLELSKLKVRAKKKGIPQEAIEAAVAVDDEDDAKHVLIKLLLHDVIKLLPTPLSPGRVCKPLSSFSCTVCSGCIRPPGHEGPCMDGQCNEMFPPQAMVEANLPSPLETVAGQRAQNRAVEEKAMLKVAEKIAAEEVELEARKKAAEEAARAKEIEEARHKAVEEARKAAESEAFRKKMEAVVETRLRAAEEARQKTAEIMEARRRVAEEAPTRRWTEQATWQAAEEYVVQKAGVESKQKTEEEEKEEEAKRKEAEAQQKIDRLRKAAEEQARQKIEEHARQRKEEEAAEMAAMDERCVHTFLECVKPCDWRPKIRTPIKGTILYTKFMRPCRAAGTSVDVKDSSFRCLGNFLEFLEKEGLLQLKPGETDPVVTAIRAHACRGYKYTPKPRTLAKDVQSEKVLPSGSGSQCYHPPR